MKALKIAGIIVAVILLAALISFLIINTRGIPTYEPGNIEYTAEITPENVERGKKLALMLCAGCHLNHETGKLTGKKMLDAPKEFGEIYSPNITQHKEYGIGNWTDGEILYLLRTGIKKNGKYAPPYMAKLPNMADEDINAIIAFLRSDDKLVKADPTPDRPPQPSFLTKALTTFVFKPLPMPEKEIPMPDESNTVELGKYLAHNLDCFACHSADFKTMDMLKPEKSEGYFGGGNKPLNEQGEVVLTANLTPDKETGIGNWSREKFIKAVRFGIKEGEPALQYPMLPYTHLTDHEAGAIYDYLQTIPPISNKVERVVYAQ
ncbi:MAG: cytochrome c [Fulvivirga sp.]|nr:cytochrome c [Fulvivirga sp.]